jgi:DNA-binding LacI/PurR family transcriptional regulator
LLNKSSNQKNSRLTVGFLIDFFWEKYQANIWAGIVQEAEKNNINLICYLGGPLNSPEAHHAPRNAVYDLVDKEHIDGLIIMTGTIGNFIHIKELEKFCNRYYPVPMVSIGSHLNGIPSILTDNEQGMRKVIEHLIIEHQFRRLAFIRGTEGNSEAESRFKVYKDVLARYDIPYNPDLVAMGDFYIGSGAKAVSYLIDHNHVEFDALIASSDIMAIDAVNELQKRKIKVPYQVAVVGFDDIEEDKCIKPPLTSVRQPLINTGRIAVKTVLSLINRETVPDTILLSAEVIIRRSCGCFMEKVDQFLIINEQLKSSVLQSGFNINDDIFLKQLVDDIAEEVSTVINHENRVEWIHELIYAIHEDLSGLKKDNFISLLDDLIVNSNKSGIEIMAWRNVISVIMRKLICQISSENELKYINNAYNNALEVIFENEHEHQLNYRLKSEKLIKELHRISIDLITTFHLDR